ncbi:MAG TPA: D-aminoacyl-tRNA deacylase [Vicinamibacteria bacterium]|nr:D-aminoacyl-tRNA deacylase [Vicinamibacteria bacterium]
MKAVVQRVSSARVEVDGEITGEIARGLLVLLGVAKEDQEKDAAWMAEKVVGLRIFEDGEGKMNRGLLDVEGALLAVSQFTLLGDSRKGRRPSFLDAAPPEEAEALYRTFVTKTRSLGAKTETGKFQAHMAVHLVNDGPVTILLDSRD